MKEQNRRPSASETCTESAAALTQTTGSSTDISCLSDEHRNNDGGDGRRAPDPAVRTRRFGAATTKKSNDEKDTAGGSPTKIDRRRRSASKSGADDASAIMSKNLQVSRKLADTIMSLCRIVNQQNGQETPDTEQTSSRDCQEAEHEFNSESKSPKAMTVYDCKVLIDSMLQKQTLYADNLITIVEGLEKKLHATETKNESYRRKIQSMQLTRSSSERFGRRRRSLIDENDYGEQASSVHAPPIKEIAFVATEGALTKGSDGLVEI